MDEIIEISSDSASDAAGENNPPARKSRLSGRLSLCSKHQKLKLQHEHDQPRPNIANNQGQSEVINLISDTPSESDVELIDVDVTCRIKVAVHTCNKYKTSRLQPVEVQAATKSSLSPVLQHPSYSKFTHSPKSSYSPSPTVNRQQSQVPHTCGLSPSLGFLHIDPPSQNCRLSPSLPSAHDHVSSPIKHVHKHTCGSQIGSTPPIKLKINPAAALQLKTLVKSLDNNLGVRSPVKSDSQTRISPTKRLLSREKRNQRRSRTIGGATSSSSSTDSDSDEHEISPSKRRLHRHTCRHKSRDTGMYLDPIIKEPVQDNQTKMPVKSHNEDILSGDLPMDTAWDPTCREDVIKRSSTPTTKAWTPVRKKRRYKSSSHSPISDSESDDELINVVKNQDRDRKHVESREDVSSPNEVANILNDRGSKALQENACLRKSHSRIASPHRNPLQVTQEQARITQNKRWGDFDPYDSKPKKFKSEPKKIKSCEQNQKNSSQNLIQEPPTLDLVMPTLTRMKQEVDTEPPFLSISCDDSDDLPAVSFLASSKSKQNERPKKKIDISKKKRHHVLHRSESSAFQQIKHSVTDLERTKSSSLTSHKKHQDENERTEHSNRSAFNLIHRYFGESPPQSDSSDVKTTDINFNKTEQKKTLCPPKSTPCPTKSSHFPPDPCESTVYSPPCRYVACIPVHMNNPEMCNNDNPESKLSFGHYIEALLEGCQEEEHHGDAMDFIESFTSVHRCPPNNVMLYLLEDIMMKELEQPLLSRTYATLKHIQHLHTPSSFKFLLDWRLVRTVMNALLADGAKVNESKLLGNYLVLKFLTGMLAEDLEAQDKKECLNRSSVFNLLSSETNICVTNMRNLTSWICKCVIRIKELETIQMNENAPPTVPVPSTSSEETCRKRLFFPSDSSPTEDDLSNPHPSTGTRLTILLRVLDLLQKMLHMSLVASSNLTQSATFVASEFFYSFKRLPRCDHKKQVLQTITCHIVRLKLIELILDDYKVTADTLDQKTLALSVGKLVEYYFNCIPSNSWKRFYDDDDADDEEEDDDDVDETRKNPAQECEELVMMLLYLMQSYLWTTNGKIPDTDRILRHRLPNDRQYASHSANQLMAFNGQFALTMADKEYLIMIGDFVDNLRSRLEAYCPNLTSLTKLYLLQLDAMRDIADCCAR